MPASLDPDRSAEASGDQAVQGVTGEVDEGKVTETIAALNDINEKYLMFFTSFFMSSLFTVLI